MGQQYPALETNWELWAKVPAEFRNYEEDFFSASVQLPQTLLNSVLIWQLQSIRCCQPEMQDFVSLKTGHCSLS